ncbi:DNA polymerase alpha subunit A [Ceratobasidium sp. AG-Ba]|nr:DNA polymerase alpha subunit A [Ceratobasidium sp. AG-Ba]
MSTEMSDLQQYLSRMRILCQQERTAEVQQSSLLLSACSPKLLEQKGLALLGLGVSKVHVGLGGKSLIELERPSAYHTSPNFPPHTFRPGDIARIEANIAGAAGKRAVKSKRAGSEPASSLDQAGVEGVVYKVSDIQIVVSTETELQDVELPERCRVVKLANSVTFDRMDRAIDSVEALVTRSSSELSATVARALPLSQTLLGLKPLQSILPLPPDFSFKDEHLNESQQEAVRFALQSPEIALIHGPPGTGKTQTLVEIIRQLVLENKRVLVCGASNLAVDNLLERLIPHQIPLTRIGHPARVMGNLHHETLDAQAARSDQAALAAGVKAELESAMSSLTGKGKGRLKGAERKKMWEEVKELRKEYRKRERVVVQSVLGEAKIVLATCHSAGSRQLGNMHFDVVCIDEACQALEAVCWTPILKGAKLILAGDPLQLPPTIISANTRSVRTQPEKGRTQSKMAKSKGRGATKVPAPAAKPHAEGVDTLGHSQSAPGEDDVKSTASSDDEDLEIRAPSIQSAHPPPPFGLSRLDLLKMLTVQYRMHKKIADFPSRTLYSSALVSHESVASHLLRDLPGVSTEPELAEITAEPVVFFDTAGCEFYEKADAEGGDDASRSNENEATLVKKWVDELVTAGLNAAQIAIITPYQAQVTLLVSLLRPTFPDLEIGTVDGMQGREKEAIILSLVRSNDKREVGFLKEKRRLNVAMTRPRRHLCVIGDSSTVEKGGTYLKNWMSWLGDNADSSTKRMDRSKFQDNKVAIEHLEDTNSATFSEDTEPAQRHRGIDQEIAQFAAQHAVEIDEETNSRLLKLINKRVLLVMLVTYFIQVGKTLHCPLNRAQAKFP